MSPTPIPPLSVSWSDAATQELAVRFELEQAATPDQLQFLENAVAQFVALGAFGGLGRSTVSPVDSSLAIKGSNLTVPTEPLFELAAKDVDVRSFQLLRHVAWRWSAQAQAIRLMELTDHTPGAQRQRPQLPDATWKTEQAAYPPQSQLLQIRVEHGDPADYQKERRCVIEFGRRVPNHVFDDVVAPISAWLQVAAQGAYGLPVKPAFEAEVWLENLGPYDEYSVELALTLFEASEAAWYSLLNCLERYSVTAEPIVLVTIE